MNNGVCTNVDGVCLAGCQDGYIGKSVTTVRKKVNFFFQFWTRKM